MTIMEELEQIVKLTEELKERVADMKRDIDDALLNPLKFNGLTYTQPHDSTTISSEDSKGGAGEER